MGRPFREPIIIDDRLDFGYEILKYFPEKALTWKQSVEKLLKWLIDLEEIKHYGSSVKFQTGMSLLRNKMLANQSILCWDAEEQRIYSQLRKEVKYLRKLELSQLFRVGTGSESGGQKR